MASTIDTVRELLDAHSIHHVLERIAQAVRDDAAYLEGRFPTDAVSQSLAADYRSIAQHVDIAASWASDKLA